MHLCVSQLLLFQIQQFLSPLILDGPLAFLNLLLKFLIIPMSDCFVFYFLPDEFFLTFFQLSLEFLDLNKILILDDYYLFSTHLPKFPILALTMLYFLFLMPNSVRKILLNLFSF